MANIGGINPASGPAPIQPNAAAKPPKAQPAPQQADSVEISLEAKIAGMLAEIPDIRAELVARVKAEIAAGTYETSENLDAAIATMLEEV